MTDILGVAFPGHDTGAALLRDGALLAAVEEERLNREKHTAAMPLQAIEFCLAHAGTRLRDLPVITIPYRLSAWRDVRRMAFHIAGNLPRLLAGPVGRRASLARDLGSIHRLKQTLRKNGFRGSFVHVDHHMAHAAATYFTSPYDDAAVLTLDGMGEWTTIMLARGTGTRLRELARLFFPHSLGYFYAGMTEYLGFRANSDEGTVMAMAAYGDYRQLVDDAFVDKLLPRRADGFRIEQRYFVFPHGGSGFFSPAFTARCGPPRSPDDELDERHFHLAALAQEVCRRTVEHLLRLLHARCPTSSLCLGGGLALNSVINGQIQTMSPFVHSHIFPAPHDGGLAVGGPLHQYHVSGKQPRRDKPFSPFLGPDIRSATFLPALPPSPVYRVEPGNDDLPGRIAAELAKGRVVALCRGRLEFGPRALGHRSILADPRTVTMRDRVNRLKGRLWFRPLAAIVPDAAVGTLFTGYSASPYMQKVFPVHADWHNVIPALVHQDGTCRLQTVAAESFCGRILTAFSALTGVPALINTSFNGPGEAIVCRFPEAEELFRRSDIDLLVTDSGIIRKAEAAHV